jgi:hypothetical protein
MVHTMVRGGSGRPSARDWPCLGTPSEWRRCAVSGRWPARSRSGGPQGSPLLDDHDERAVSPTARLYARTLAANPISTFSARRSRRSGSQATPRWRKVDPNHRYRGRRPAASWCRFPFAPNFPLAGIKQGDMSPRNLVVSGGTNGSNPASSSGESGANSVQILFN